MHNKNALVLFSGGQDSTTCLAWALARYARVETIGFQYGQRHAVELTQRPIILSRLRESFPTWANRLKEDHVLKTSLITTLSTTAMTNDMDIAMPANGLPNTFVPGRNLLFITLASMLAYQRGLTVLVGGMCETDFSGYPDCRDNTIKALQVALNLGMASPFILETPVMWRDKADIWALAKTLGKEALLNIIRTETHTCYLGKREALHAWGYGCGECPACVLRSRGYEKFLKAACTTSHSIHPPFPPMAPLLSSETT